MVAAWDLAFHTLPLSAVDIDFAKEQLDVMLGPKYLHPNGQIPAYEWNFSDVNPPVHPWATLAVYRAEEAARGKGDVDFLKRSFGKLVANFTGWLNRKDRSGKNVFEGGLLGLDNIGVFDRSSPLPTGGYLEQADGTAWMAFFSQNMLGMAIKIAVHDPSYDCLAAKFKDHVLWISHAVNRAGPGGLRDEDDGFFYDVLQLPDGSATRLKVRSVVGLLPLCATTVMEPWERERVPQMMKRSCEKFQTDPLWRDHLLFPEYFHGDTGAAVGASHQTGWTGLVALLIQLRGSLEASQFLQEGKEPTFAVYGHGERK